MLAGQMPAPAVQVPREGFQEITSRVYELPALPGDIQEAERRYDEIQKLITAELRELDADLRAGYLGAGKGPEFQLYSRKIVVPRSQAERAAIATRFIKDYTYLNLEDRVLDQWNEWQSALLNRAYLLEGQKGKTPLDLKARFFPLNYADYGNVKPDPPLRIFLAEDGLKLQEEIVRNQPRLPGIVVAQPLDYRKGDAEHEAARRLAQSEAPDLARLWAPLREKITRSAVELLNFDAESRDIRDPGFRALLAKARIQVLERCRFNLWFCQLVWAHYASRPLPALYERFRGIF
jgi:hypothetical protein